MVKQNSPKADEWKAWPDKLELGGFMYDRLGGLMTQDEAEMAARPVSWFKAWLKKQPHYAPQPYEQLAKALVGFRGHGVGDVLQPDLCHLLVLKPLIFQGS
jgi:hypothetical protein